MNEPRAMVANAADKGQVKHAGRKEKTGRTRELADLAVVLNSVEGRRFVWRLMGWSGMYENPSSARGDVTHQNIGKADAGRFLLSEIMQCDEKKFLLMQQEAWAIKRSDEVEAEAHRTPSASQSNNGTADSDAE